MIQLLSTDFDGTIINHDAKPAVVPEMLAALHDLHAAGVKWAVNTGRTLWHIEDALKREFVFPIQPDFVLVEERDIYHREGDGPWKPMGDWNACCVRDHDAMFHLAGPLLAEVLAFLERFQGVQTLFDKGRFIGAVTANGEDMDRLCHFLDELRARLPMFSYQRNTIYIRFCHEAYSKGTALGELARLTGISRDEIFAAGDHYNDLPMLDGRHAAWVACPGNAVEAVQRSVREAGGYVARGLCSDGVVEALRHFGAASGVEG